MKVAVIAPHPDDEVLGCGGTVAKHVADGDETHLIIVTSGWTPMVSTEFMSNREGEIREAVERLGFDEVHELDYPAAKLDTIEQRELNDSFTDLLSDLDPDILYIPSAEDLHRDHRIVHEAALVAARPHVCGVERILAYETLSETEWGGTLGEFSPAFYVDISETLDRKLAAMEAYESEVREPPHPRSIERIETKAQVRGSEVCLEAAEAFSLVREIHR